MQILFLSFGIDVLIHAVLKFGLHTSYIYGGHFVFVIPMLWGWGVKAYQNTKFYPFTIGLTFILGFYLLLNNGYRMVEFFDFLNQYYR